LYFMNYARSNACDNQAQLGNFKNMSVLDTP